MTWHMRICCDFAAVPIRSRTGQVCQHCMQALYFYLSSDSRLKIHAALALLNAVAKHSVHAARQLTDNFDFSLSALAKLCRLPR